MFIVVRDRTGHLRRASERQALGHDVRIAFLQWALSLCLLADRAWWMADAIVRTLVRLTVTHTHLLDWTTAASGQACSNASQLDVASYVMRMKGGMAVAVLVAATVLLLTPANFWLAAPWFTMWFIAPLLARHISLPQTADRKSLLSDADATALRLVARRTWRFFERFVTAEDRFLPPDNFQETPTPVVAHRTSPTNIGGYLLSSVSAFEFGWTGLVDWVGRVEATMNVLGLLERHRGHFYNWYDTRTAQPMLPTYISTVDSGNLAGHLIALANAAEAAMSRPLWGPECPSGIADALALVDQSAERPLDAFARLSSAVAAASDSPADLPADMRAITTAAAEIIAAAAPRSTEDANWLEIAAQCAFSHARDLDLLTPPVARDIPSLMSLARDEAAPTTEAAQALIGRLTVIAATARRFANEMDFRFLFKEDRMLLSIGFIVAENRLDSSDYDLLASEARLASFIAIAKRDIPSRHWFRLGRRSVAVGAGTALLSWSGSMFEYLMPSLVMGAPTGSLLERALRLAVHCQRAYGDSHRIPWGVSESAYNVRDVEQTYQYSPFGVPALGLKRGLGSDLVVSPYSTGLAAMVDPVAAAANFRALTHWGALGRFGFFEALDFTPDRLAEGERVAIVRAYMAHHQGMTIIAIANALLGGVVRGHFHAEPAARATELLLQEKPPRSIDDLPQAPNSRCAKHGCRCWPASAGAGCRPGDHGHRMRSC